MEAGIQALQDLELQGAVSPSFSGLLFLWSVIVLYGLYTSAIGDYSSPTNTDRPGGSLSVATLKSSAFPNPTTTFRLVADTFTIYSFLDDILTNCSSHNLVNDTVFSTITPYTDSPSCLPRPESTVQYYRGSSINLALEGYNNSAAAYSNTDGVPKCVYQGIECGAFGIDGLLE